MSIIGPAVGRLGSDSSRGDEVEAGAELHLVPSLTTAFLFSRVFTKRMRRGSDSSNANA